MDVATIIVNYRTAAATIDAVSSLFDEIEQFVNPVIVVVDNDSRDGSLELLNEAFVDAKWRGRVVVVASKHNGGFGYGVNVGVKHVIDHYGQPSYFYILNPDAKIDPGSLEQLVAFMNSHPDAGLLGNVVRHASGDHLHGFRFPSLLGELEGRACLGLLTRLLDNRKLVMPLTKSCEVDWVSGVSMMFRSKVFSTSGLFDEGFFLYFEEIDLACRIRKAGWKIYFVADASVDHIGGLSTGFWDETRRMPKYWFESRRRYFVKHHGRLYAAACDAAWLCGYAIFVVKSNLKGRRKETTRPSEGRDFLRYSLANLLKPAPEAEQNLPPARWAVPSEAAAHDAALD